MKSNPRGKGAAPPTVGGGRGAALLACALGLVLFAVPAFALDDELLGALKRVERVVIEGNRSVDTGDIKKVIRTGSSSFLGLKSQPLYRPDFLRSDAITIQNLYARRGFLSASVAARADSGKTTGKVVVVYSITEGPRSYVRKIEADTVGVVSPDEMKKLLHLAPGDPYDPVQVILDRTAIANKFSDRGHFPAIETEIRHDSTLVDVHYRIVPGPAYRVRDVQVMGVADVDSHAVSREVLLKPGDLYRQERVTQSSERLYQTGLFNAVEVAPYGADTTNALVSIQARVRERKPRWVEGGVGTGSYERIRLSGEWGHRNLTGEGRTLTTQLSYGFYPKSDTLVDLWQAKALVAFIEPWLLNTRTRGRIAASIEHGFQDLASADYVQDAYGLSFGVSRDVGGPKSQVSLTLDNTWTRNAEVVNRSPGDTTEFFIPAYAQRWTLAYSDDLRDNPLDPRHGAIVAMSGQMSTAIEGGQGPYLKFEALSGWHLPTGPKTSVGLRARAGYITTLGPGPSGDEGTLQRVPITDVYRTGGSASVRGYRENGIDDGGGGGRFLVNANLEYRFPLKGILTMAAFTDAGNVWRRLTDVKLSRLFGATGIGGSYGAADVRWSYGLGLRIGTPIGPLRFDYARRVHIDETDVLYDRDPDRGGLSFSLGQMF